MNKTLIMLSSILFLFSAAGHTGTNAAFQGNYYLNIQGLSRYDTDVIRVRSISDAKVTGEVGIDWGIGAQAKKAETWETYHSLPFEAKVLYGGKAFRFSVTVAKKTVYEFTLFFVYDRDYRKNLVGSVQVTPVGKKSETATNVYGVIAERVLSEK